MTVDWTKAPKEAQWYQPATGLVNAAWFYKDADDGKWFATNEEKAE